MQLNLAQLFSTPENCLPEGRQTLRFDIDFSQSQTVAIGSQQLNSIRRFAGIRGMFLQGASGNYAVAGEQNWTGGSNQGLLYSTKSNQSYWFDGANILRFGQAGLVTINNIPAGLTPVTTSVNQDYLGTLHPGIIGSDGFLYMIAGNNTNTSLSTQYSVLQIDPDTGTVTKNAPLTTGDTNTAAGGYISFSMNSQGILAASFVLGASTTESQYVVAFDTAVFAVKGVYKYTYASGFSPSVSSVNFDSSGNVLAFGYGTVPQPVFVHRVFLQTLNAGVYSGTYVDITSKVATGYEPFGVICNQSGGYVLRQSDSTRVFDQVFNGDDDVIVSANVTSNALFSVDVFSSYPEKGFADYYAQIINNDPTGNPVSVSLIAFDSITLIQSSVITLPLAGGQPPVYGLFVNVDIGDVYWPNRAQSFYFAIQSTTLTVKVNGTGQQFIFNLTPSFFAWIPLFALENDNVTFSSPSGKITGYLTNFDVVPFIVS